MRDRAGFKTFVTGVLLFLLTFQAMALSPADLARLGQLSSADKQQLLDMAKQSGLALPGGISAAQRGIAPATATGQKQTDAGLDKKQLEQDANLPEMPQRIKPNDSLIVYFDMPEDDQKILLSLNVDKENIFEPKTPQQLYILDKHGVLDMPGIGKIPLAGLKEEEAAARLNLEPLLQRFIIRVKHLPLEPTGKAALKPFGYELFRNQEVTTETFAHLPVPAEYMVGPGDIIYIQLFGKENQEYGLEVSRDGTLIFPGVGAVPVAGLTFRQLKQDLANRIKKQFIGVDAYITMGELRSINVFVVGEVEKPGSYLVSGLSSITHALIHAGGIKEIGSLRHIELKRNSKLLVKFDLYDLLLKGDARNDIRLQAGDVVHVPALQRRVAISGEVLRPAIYELKEEKNLADLVRLAGGLLPDAYQKNVEIHRSENGINRQVVNVDLSIGGSDLVALHDGDSVVVHNVDAFVEESVTLTGHVKREGMFKWNPMLKLTDVIQSIDELKIDADLDYVVIKRYLPPYHELSVVTADLRRALAKPSSKDNPVLQPRDEIIVLDKGETRALALKPIVDELLRDAKASEPAQIVRINGQVHGPGTYPLVPDMRIDDLIRAGGKLDESAYTLEAELTRFIVEPDKPRRLEHLSVDLDKVLAGDEAANITLQPYDLLTVKEIPLWTEEDHVELMGEVRFPGKYPIKRGETMSQLLERAGGLTEYAYPRGAVFMREELRKKEQERMEEMARNLEAELATLSLERAADPSRIQSAAPVQQLIEKLRTSKAAGRMVIDLPEIVKMTQGEGDKSLDIVMRGGDKLFVPSFKQEVSVIGQVFHPTSHMYREHIDLDEYVNLSGGATNRADTKNIYVIRADGSVQLAARYWFSKTVALQPGDTIVVPFDADRVSALKLWTDLSSIVYQLGLSAAAWHTVGLL